VGTLCAKQPAPTGADNGDVKTLSDILRALVHHHLVRASWARAVRARRLYQQALLDALIVLAAPSGSEVVTPRGPRVAGA
jgi:hypothetical protein